MAKNTDSHVNENGSCAPDPYHLEKLKQQHKSLEERLGDLSRRSVHTPAEENEMREIKHQKLLIKDKLFQSSGLPDEEA
ncbi:MAG: YdcH family protein [Leptospirales bacterium]